MVLKVPSPVWGAGGAGTVYIGHCAFFLSISVIQRSSSRSDLLQDLDAKSLHIDTISIVVVVTGGTAGKYMVPYER